MESSSETVQWDVHSSASSDIFGAIPDNTIGDITGHFILTSAAQQNLFSRLISEKLEPTDNVVCLSFYYYFANSSEYNLTMLLGEYKKEERILWTLIDTLQTTVYGMWRFGQVSFEPTDSYRVYIEAFVGNNPRHFVGE